MHRQPFKKLLLIFVFPLVFSACNFNSIYKEHVVLEDEKWYKDEAVHFEVEIVDSLSAFDFYLSLRNSTDYRYSNLFVFLMTRFPNGNMTRDTIEIVLADREGRWLGKGWGKLKQNDVLLKRELHFPLTGKYSFFIQQAMRVDTLEGIHDVGLEISKVDK
ncbi:MAG: gliding motility lipoprotein GldH [Bacteroidales bacterium]|nr:gliding motility lipoprotein GldH [Bacteroidales bacterium]